MVLLQVTGSGKYFSVPAEILLIAVEKDDSADIESTLLQNAEAFLPGSLEEILAANAIYGVVVPPVEARLHGPC